MTIEILVDKCCGSVTAEKVEDVSIKEFVRDRYKRAVDEQSGCGCGCGDSDDDSEFSFVKGQYEDREGYESDADLGLGCGVPTEYAGIREGDTVLDLGSGAGIDAFIARVQTGETGQLIGVDFTPEMVERAKENARNLGYENVEFVEGDIEDLPIKDAFVDVVISNCVLNLVPDKTKAFAEMYRVTRPGGHFCISDIVFNGDLPIRMRESAALYAGCISGAIEQGKYLQLLGDTGFVQVRVVKHRPITLPDSLLREAASPQEIEAFKTDGGIASITVTGVRGPVNATRHRPAA